MACAYAVERDRVVDVVVVELWPSHQHMVDMSIDMETDVMIIHQHAAPPR